MTQQPTTFKTVQILFYALLGGQLFFGLVIFFLMKNDLADRSVESPYHIIIPMAVVLGIAASRMIWQKQKGGIPLKASAKEKIEHYRRALVMRAAIAEGANLIALLFTFSFATIPYLLWFGLGIATFALLRPTLDGFSQEYQLTQNEIEEVL